MRKPKYATCGNCGKTMAHGHGCTYKFIGLSDGTVYKRIRYGYGGECDYIDAVGDPEYKYCHDCGVKAGQLHHQGCDMETCPKCKGQLIGCECGWVQVGKYYPTFYSKCPRCGQVKDMRHPALSRKDNKTEVCGDCGVKEAMEAFKNRKDK